MAHRWDRQHRSPNGEPFSAILRRADREQIEAQASAPNPTEMLKYSMASTGAQFCEVRVREDSDELRVSRWVGSFDCGRIGNHKTATSQLRGGIIMGIGMALSEETLLDERSGPSGSANCRSRSTSCFKGSHSSVAAADMSSMSAPP